MKTEKEVLNHRKSTGSALTTLLVVLVVIALIAGVVVMGFMLAEQERSWVIQLDENKEVVRTFWEAYLYPLNDLVEDGKARGLNVDQVISEINTAYPDFRAKDHLLRDRKPLSQSDEYYSGLALLQWIENDEHGQKLSWRGLKDGDFIIRPIKTDPLNVKEMIGELSAPPKLP